MLYKHILNSKKKSKATWDIIKNKADTVKTQINEITNKDMQIRNPVQIANIINDFFIASSNNHDDKSKCGDEIHAIPSKKIITVYF